MLSKFSSFLLHISDEFPLVVQSREEKLSINKSTFFFSSTSFQFSAIFRLEYLVDQRLRSRYCGFFIDNYDFGLNKLLFMPTFLFSINLYILSLYQGKQPWISSIKLLTEHIFILLWKLEHIFYFGMKRPISRKIEKCFNL